jgi:membrane-associated phospholipid phosphatase
MKCTTTQHPFHVNNVHKIPGLLGDFSFGTFLKVFVLFCWLGKGMILPAQDNSPYQFSKPNTLAITLGSVAFGVGSQLLQNSISPLSPQTLAGLDRMNIPAFERNVSYNWRPEVAKFSDGLLIGSILLPTALFAAKPIRQDIKKPLVLGIQAIHIGYGITGFTKAMVRRNRPFTYIQNTNDPDLLERQLKNDARFSFFSGHTSITATMTFLGAKMFSDYYPESRAKVWVWASAIILPAVVGYMRVRSGKHFPSDVITGYLIGGSVGFWVPHFHRKR